MDRIFSLCLSLASLPDITKWNVEKIHWGNPILLDSYNPTTSKWDINSSS